MIKKIILIAGESIIGKALFDFFSNEFNDVDIYPDIPIDNVLSTHDSVVVIDLFTKDHGYGQRMSILTSGYQGDIFVFINPNHVGLLSFFRLPKFMGVISPSDSAHSIVKKVRTSLPKERVRLPVFTLMEIHIIHLLFSGYSIDSISNELNTKQKNVHNHKYNIMRKLRIKKSNDLFFIIKNIPEASWHVFSKK